VQKKRKETAKKNNESNERTLPPSKTGRQTSTSRTASNKTPQQQSTFGTVAAWQERKNGSCHGWLRKKVRVWKMKKCFFLVWCHKGRNWLIHVGCGTNSTAMNLFCAKNKKKY
jgi:hypothetical protein